MIYEAMNCLVLEMNEFFRNKLQVKDEKVILSGPVGPDRQGWKYGEDKVVTPDVDD